MEKPQLRPSCIGFAGVDWWYHNRAHSEFQILTRLARNRKVLIVNSIGMRMPIPGKTSRPFYKIWRKLKSIARLVQRPDPSLPGLYIYSPFPWPFFGSEFSRLFGAWVVRFQVTIVSRAIGIDNPVIFVTPPVAYPIVARMKKLCLLYNRSDKHSLFREADSALLEQLEEQLLRNADLTFYANRTLMAEEQRIAKNQALHIDHGVDSEHFDFTRIFDEPAALASIPRPRVGFFGNLRSYMVDFSLFIRLAKALPNAQIVLIGDPQDSTEELEGFANIHILGQKPYSEIPSYGAFFDVAMVPYQDNDWIRYCNPIKMKEYLALGLMVVSTDFPEAHAYSDRIRIAADASDFVDQVQDCLEHPNDASQRLELRNTVAQETWNQRTQILSSYIDQLYLKHRKSSEVSRL